MRNDPSGREIKATWQNQVTETHRMSQRLIQWKARELHAKTRRQLLGTLAGPLAAGLLYAFSAKVFPPGQFMLNSVFVFALAWSLAGVYFLNRGMWTPEIPGDAGLRTGLEFCRREIERRRELLQGVLLWSFGPIIFAIAAFILGLSMIGSAVKRILPNGLPFLALVAVWIVAYFVIRLREQNELQRELEELNAIEREDSR